MKILFVASYYWPYTSGLTIYAQRLAEGLAGRGHKITVLTNQYPKNLAGEEKRNGVRVRRVKPLLRFSRGFITPALLACFLKELLKTEAVGLHLPLPEAFVFASLAKVFKKKVVLIYHANLNLPSWLISTPIIENMVLANHVAAGIFANKIVAYSQDYANFAKFLKIFRKKTKTIYPPILIDKPNFQRTRALRRKWAPLGEKTVGFVGRFAEEKGGDILIEAIPELLKVIPKIKVVFIGEHKDLIYEDFYQRKRDLVSKYQENLVFLGPVDHRKIANFFGALDVLALPSRAECFGIVQVEAMLCGCPVVAFDIPGGRVPIRVTGMGKIAGKIDAKNLANSIVEVLKNRKKYLKPRKEIEKVFNYQKTFNDYKKLFLSMKGVKA